MKREKLEDLVNWKTAAQRKPLILRGARQVGKTWLLKRFGEAQFPDAHYLNFELDSRLDPIFQGDLNPQRIVTELEFYFDKKIDTGKDLLIFDEIQQSPRALNSLKYFCEDLPDLAICAAGSLLGVQLAEESFPVGKVEFLTLHPLNFFEFLAALNQEMLLDLVQSSPLGKALPETAHRRLWEHWKVYLLTGGLPAVVERFSDSSIEKYNSLTQARVIQKDLIQAYLADVAKHSGKLNALHLERLWMNVPEQLAREQDSTLSKFKFKDVLPGIRGYERLIQPIAWLEGAMLLNRVSIVTSPTEPLRAFSKENIFKLYFFDTGLLSAVSGIQAKTLLDYKFGSYKGYIAENFVAQELTTRGIIPLHSWRGRTSEIEFLLELPGGPIPVEVKAGANTKAKSLSIYEKQYQPEYSIVLSGKNEGSSGRRIQIPIYMASRIMEDPGPGMKISAG